MRKTSLFFLSFSLLTCALAQDIHFSQYNQSYLNLNPAATGQFDGDYRFNGNYRNQWSSISEPFLTYSVSMEAKGLIKKLPQLDMGIVLYQDEAGLGDLKTTNAMLSLAYSKKLNSDSTFLIRGGIQMGLLARSINFQQFSFDRQYQNGGFDSNLDNGEDFVRDGFSSFNFNAGIASEYRIEQRKSFTLGFSLFNLSQPNQSFQGSNIPLDLRSTFYLSSDYYLSEKMDLLPSILYSRQGKFKETVIGSNLRYRMSSSGFYKRNVYGGVWYRNADAIIVSTGMDYNQWQVGLSYDINISDLDVASNNRDGLEIAVTYIFKEFKPIIRRYKVCPKFL